MYVRFPLYNLTVTAKILGYIRWRMGKRLREYYKIISRHCALFQWHIIMKQLRFFAFSQIQWDRFRPITMPTFLDCDSQYLSIFLLLFLMFFTIPMIPLCWFSTFFSSSVAQYVLLFYGSTIFSFASAFFFSIVIIFIFRAGGWIIEEILIFSHL